MKFACEHCSTKYSIPDDRVRGKVLKIRCTKCGELISVKGEDARPPASAAAAPAAAPRPQPRTAGPAPVKASPSLKKDDAGAALPAKKGSPAETSGRPEKLEKPDKPDNKDMFSALLEEASAPPARSEPVVPERGRRGLGKSAPSPQEPAAKKPSQMGPAKKEPAEGRVPASAKGKASSVFPLREQPKEEADESSGDSGPPSGDDGVEWFYSKGGKQIGPTTADEMRELISSRVLTPKSYIWREGMEDWSRLTTVPEFAREVSDAAPTTDERRQTAGEGPRGSSPKAAAATGGDRDARGSAQQQAVPKKVSAVSEAARRRDEELEQKLASSGVFDDLLRDMDDAKKGKSPVEDDRFLKVAGLAPAGAGRKDAKKGEKKPAAARDALSAAAEDDFPFEAGAAVPPPHEGDASIFESALAEEAKQQAAELAVVEAAEAEKRSRQMAIAELSSMEDEQKEEPRESTRVVILKAGLSAKARMRRMIITVAVVVAAIGGLSWFVSTKLNTIYNMGLAIVKPQLSKPQSTEEIGMTPEERDRYRKVMLGIEEEKKEAEVIKKKAVAKKQGQGPAFGITGVDLKEVDTKGMMTGLGKEDVAFGAARMGDDKVSGIDLGGLGVASASVGIEKKDGPIELKPDLGTVFKELGTDQVGKVVASNQRSLRYCYEKHLKGDSGLSGRVLIRAEVQGTGRVSKVVSLTDRIKGSMIEECLLKEIKKWQFPKFEAAATAVEIPLVLTSSF